MKPRLSVLLLLLVLQKPLLLCNVSLRLINSFQPLAQHVTFFLDFQFDVPLFRIICCSCATLQRIELVVQDFQAFH